MPSLTAKHPRSESLRPYRRVISESLEIRRMLFGFTIDGTSGNDSISIGVTGNDILFVVNGVSDTRSNSLFDEVTINCLGGNDSVSIIDTSDNLITVLGGAGNDTIRAGNGGNDLTVVRRNLVVNAGANTDKLFLHDSARSGPTSYTINGDTFDSNFTGAIDFIATEQLEISAGADSNSLAIDSLPAADVKFLPGANNSFGDTLSVTGLASESITLSPSGTTLGSYVATLGARTIEGANVENMTVRTAQVVLVTPNSNDTVSVVGSNVTVTSGGMSLGKIQVLSPASFLLDVATNDNTHSTDAVTIASFAPPSGRLDLNAGGGINTLSVFESAIVDTGFGTLAGSAVDVRVDGANVTFEGFQQLKSLRLEDLASAKFNGNGNVLSTATLSIGEQNNNLIRETGQSVVVTQSFSVEADGLLQLNGAGTLTIASTAVQSHGVNSVVQTGLGTFNLESDAGTPLEQNLTLRSSPNSSVVLRSTQHLFAIVANGGIIRTERGQTPVSIVSLSMNVLEANGGRFDLADDLLFIDYSGTSPLNDIKTDILSGRNGGTWNGTGINSSAATLDPNTAIGFGEITDLLGPIGGGVTFLGQSVDDTTIVLRHTLLGDADLDRSVGFGDLLILAQNYNATGRSWTRGNFDFDASSDVGFGDLLILAQHYGQSLLTSASNVSTPRRSRAVSRAISVVD